MAVIFPNVPLVPGVPPVPRDPASIIETIELLTSDAIILFNSFFGKIQWGIFSNGLPVVLADNVVSLDYKEDYIISNYPVEGGAFRSYDKVHLPFEGRLQFSTGGSVAARQAFIASVQRIIGDTNLYDIYTPEQIYRSVNLKHWDFNREAQSVGLLKIDIWCEQVAVTGTQTFQNVQSPTSNSPIANGSVAPGSPPGSALPVAT